MVTLLEKYWRISSPPHTYKLLKRIQRTIAVKLTYCSSYFNNRHKKLKGKIVYFSINFKIAIAFEFHNGSSKNHCERSFNKFQKCHRLLRFHGDSLKNTCESSKGGEIFEFFEKKS